VPEKGIVEWLPQGERNTEGERSPDRKRADWSQRWARDLFIQERKKTVNEKDHSPAKGGNIGGGKNADAERKKNLL